MFKDLKNKLNQSESDYVFVSDLDLHDSYDSLLDQLMDKKIIIFDDFNYKLRDLNKRLIDISVEAILDKIIFIETYNEEQLFKEELIEIKKYMDQYKEVETLMIRLPLLMDELYIKIVNEEPLPKNRFTVLSKIDVEKILEKVILKDKFIEKEYNINGIAMSEIEDYYKAFDEDEVVSTSTYFDKYDMDIITWQSFVKNKRTN